MQTKDRTDVNDSQGGPTVDIFAKQIVADRIASGDFGFRQGLWIEDLRTPPGQECSNGSLILLAVVLWRTSFLSRLRRRRPQPPNFPMKLLKVKTVRFGEVVDNAGKPEPYTLWQKPATDRHFQSALKNHRVMTIQQSETGT